ncbi:MAG: hypothetical protein ABFS17_04740 [Chloroflexota bacterium]
MNRNRKLLVLAIVLSLTILACSALSNNSGNNTTDTGSSRDVLFEDDFSRTSTGWDRFESEEAATDYGDDVYRIQIKTEDYIAWAGPYVDFADVIIEVETYKASGGDDNGFGIVCRHVDVENFYFLEISSDGFAWIGKQYNAEFELLDSTESNQINLGNATNDLRAECVGNRIALYINGTLELEAIDSDLSHGDVGLIAETYTSTSTEILFDNFIVTKP